MKLNPDCFRDILLTIEEVVEPDVEFNVNEENYTIYERLKKYDFKTIQYHINQCISNNLFAEYHVMLKPNYFIFDLSPEGHEFLENIRNNDIWHKVLKKIGEAGIGSLKMLVELAKAAALAQLTSNIGL